MDLSQGHHPRARYEGWAQSAQLRALTESIPHRARGGSLPSVPPFSQQICATKRFGLGLVSWVRGFVPQRGAVRQLLFAHYRTGNSQPARFPSGCEEIVPTGEVAPVRRYTMNRLGKVLGPPRARLTVETLEDRAFPSTTTTWIDATTLRIRGTDEPEKVTVFDRGHRRQARSRSLCLALRPVYHRMAR
jgi:hypothetical protein